MGAWLQVGLVVIPALASFGGAYVTRVAAWDQGELARFQQIGKKHGHECTGLSEAECLEKFVSKLQHEREEALGQARQANIASQSLQTILFIENELPCDQQKIDPLPDCVGTLVTQWQELARYANCPNDKNRVACIQMRIASLGNLKSPPKTAANGAH